MVLRFLLGAAESLISPGFVLLGSRFYTVAEQPLRVGIWYSCQGIGSFLGSMISYGMGHVNTVRGSLLSSALWTMTVCVSQAQKLIVAHLSIFLDGPGSSSCK